MCDGIRTGVVSVCCARSSRSIPLHTEHPQAHRKQGTLWSLMRRFTSLLACVWTGFCPAQTPGNVPAGQAATAAGNPAAVTEYVLQRGDDLSIRAYNLSQLDGEFRVRPDGKISVLLLNDVQAAGLTPTQLGQFLSESYSQHFRNPRVTVIVRSIAAQNVYVGGDVAIPAAVPVRGQMSAVQAVMAAGGVKDVTSDEVIIVHAEQGEPRTESVSVQEVLSGQRTDPVLRPSDTVYVRRSTINVFVGGEVGHPGMVPLSGGMTIIAAIFQAGGFRQTAKTNSVVLLRDGGKSGPVAMTVSLEDVFTDGPRTKLQPFDVVFVPKSKIAKLNQWVDQYIRQMSPATLSMGFSYLFGQSFSTVSSSPF